MLDPPQRDVLSRLLFLEWCGGIILLEDLTPSSDSVGDPDLNPLRDPGLDPGAITISTLVDAEELEYIEVLVTTQCAP